MGNDGGYTSGFSSPPCFAHELEYNEYGGFAGVDTQTALDVARFRKAKREELRKTCQNLPAAARRAAAEAVQQRLDQVIDLAPGRIIACYSPLGNELDLQPWMHRIARRGARVALPVVTGKNEPLLFREWTLDCVMVEGMWRIPVPADGAELTPEIIIVPLVGFDAANYRLGNGGGFYDRTLSRMNPRPMTIGVGYSLTKISSIFPQPHDIPMDIIVTEKGDPIRREDLASACTASFCRA